ncbi:MAG TPA: hypothetical protein VGS19_04635 [Streptosporangiaceae bacterium]|nr:hypothetical protein [Streptosporangiaceae bacterium]
MVDGVRWLRASRHWVTGGLTRAWAVLPLAVLRVKGLRAAVLRVKGLRAAVFRAAAFRKAGLWVAGRRWAVATVGVVAVTAVAGLVWWAPWSAPARGVAGNATTGRTAQGHHRGPAFGPVSGTGTSSGGAKSLAAILAPDLGGSGTSRPLLHSCASSTSTVATLHLQAVVGSVACAGTPGSSISLWAYQFGNVMGYEKGFLQLNGAVGWDAAKAGHRCPSSGHVLPGRVKWQDPPRYPSQSGQVLDCNPAPKTGSPQFVWAMPTQRVVFRATDAQAGATYGSLWDWLRSVHFD